MLQVTITIASFHNDVPLRVNGANNKHGSYNNTAMESHHHDSVIQHFGILGYTNTGKMISDVKRVIVDGNVNGNRVIDAADARNTINTLEIGASNHYLWNIH